MLTTLQAQRLPKALLFDTKRGALLSPLMQETRKWLYERYQSKDTWLKEVYSGHADSDLTTNTTSTTNNDQQGAISDVVDQTNKSTADQISAQPTPGILPASSMTRRLKPPMHQLLARMAVTMAVCLAPYMLLSRKQAATFVAIMTTTSTLLSRFICYR